MQAYQFKVTLKIQSPFLTQTSDATRLGTDLSFLRNAEQRPLIPGSLIRGNLRHAWQALSNWDDTFDAETIRNWLGDTAHQNAQPQRAQLSFSPYWHTSESHQSGEISYRIALDPATQTVKPGALMSIETPFSQGKTCLFQGDIHAWLEDSKAADKLTRWLRLGLRYIPAIGALKGIGFGKLIEDNTYPKIDCNVLQPPSEQSHYEPGKHTYNFAIKPNGPLCFAQAQLGNNTPFNETPDASTEQSHLNNTFTSETFIPGSAIKGAIAQTLCLMYDVKHLTDIPQECEHQLLAQYLDQIRFVHGRPAKDDHTQREPVIPLSLVSYSFGDQAPQFLDIAWHTYPEQPALLLKYENTRVAPLFQIDWKSKVYHAAANAFQQHQPDYLLTLHTAIDAKTGASAEHQLYAVHAVSEQDTHWLSHLTLPSHLPENETKILIQSLETIFSLGLNHLGKTKARGKIQWLTKADHPPKTFNFKEGDRLVIVLQSATRLLTRAQRDIPASNGDEALHRAYQENWQQLSDKSLKLIHAYTQETLLGGSYLWHRYWKPLSKAYNPEVMTQAGSVFVLQVEPNQAKTANRVLEAWQAEGLPQLADALGNEDWQLNPYQRFNGYGEILIHTDPQPLPDGVTLEPLTAQTI